MNVVMSESDYSSIEESADTIFDRRKNLPENVFVKSLAHFEFLTFDALYLSGFFENLQKFTAEIREDQFWISVVDPDPRTYFAANYGFYGAIEFSSGDTSKDYIRALNDFPEQNSADALVSNSSRVLFGSLSGSWGIVGDRDADIGVCAFDSFDKKEKFQSIHGNLLGGVQQAAEYAYGNRENDVERNRFCSSFDG